MAEERASEENNPTMEEILQTIRGVIAGETESDEQSAMGEILDDIAGDAGQSDDPLELSLEEDDELVLEEAADDVLELTELVEEEPAVDVLDEIDEAIGVEEEPVIEEPPMEELPVEEEAEGLDQAALDALLQEEVEPQEVEEPIIPEPLPEPELEPEPEPEEPVVVPMDDIAVEEQEPEEQANTLETEALSEVSKGLISEQSALLSSQALKDLVTKVPKTGPGFRSGLMLEDLVIEALRPYLKEWLDNNLPDLVKKLVEKEISRLVPKDE